MLGQPRGTGRLYGERGSDCLADLEIRTVDTSRPGAQNTHVPSTDAPEAVYKLLGERLAHLRGERDVTQEDLGTFAGLTRASIANIEKGRQRIFLHQLYHFALFLRVDLRDLLPEPNQVQNAGLLPEAEADYLAQLRSVLESKPQHHHQKRRT